MRALVIEHDPDGGAAGVGERLEEHGFTLDSFQILKDGNSTHSDKPFPNTDQHDLLLVMGSVHSVYDTATIGSWIGREVTMVAEALAVNKPVLGICFGGQVLSVASGGTVEKAHAPEVGWHTVHSEYPMAVPVGPWFQWHIDRFSLPQGSKQLAHNDHGTQAFQLGRSLGVQFHPEVNPNLVGRWLAQNQEEVERKGIDATKLLRETHEHHPAARKRADGLIDWFLEEVAFP